MLGYKILYRIGLAAFKLLSDKILKSERLLAH